MSKSKNLKAELDNFAHFLFDWSKNEKTGTINKKKEHFVRTKFFDLFTEYKEKSVPLKKYEDTLTTRYKQKRKGE